MWITSLFGEKNDLNTLQECARAIVVFLYGLALVRIAGRRMFGKWSALDIVVSIIIGSNLSRIITGNAPFVGTLAATTLLVMFHWVLANLCARSPAAMPRHTAPTATPERECKARDRKKPRQIVDARLCSRAVARDFHGLSRRIPAINIAG